MLRIDAHHHLWRYDQDEYAWINDQMTPLRQDFLSEDLSQTLSHMPFPIDGTIAVQARQTVEETQWLLTLSKANPVILGVIGWLPLLANDLPKLLDQFASEPTLVGLREIVQAHPPGYLDQPAFNQGIQHLTARNYAYDLLIRADQLEEATRFIDRHPNQRFILDHAAKPLIAAAQLEPWRSQILELSRRPNIACKLSGLVTEADWQTWTPAHLQPYLDTCLEAFGTDRLLAGSDWPVCLLATSYQRWWSLLEQTFSDTEHQAILGTNTQRLYQLSPQ